MWVGGKGFIWVWSTIPLCLAGSLPKRSSSGERAFIDLADPGSFDIVSPLRSAAAEVEMIEVVDKIIAEFRGTSLASEAAGYEFHISHETSKWIQPFSRLTSTV
jgi:hypothetical protein